jgi:predicted DNA-binding protein
LALSDALREGEFDKLYLNGPANVVRVRRPQRLSVNLPENTAEALDKFAARYRVSKSWLLHRLVENGLEQLEKDGAERILFGSSKK